MSVAGSFDNIPLNKLLVYINIDVTYKVTKENTIINIFSVVVLNCCIVKACITVIAILGIIKLSKNIEYGTLNNFSFTT